MEADFSSARRHSCLVVLPLQSVGSLLRALFAESDNSPDSFPGLDVREERQAVDSGLRQSRDSINGGAPFDHLFQHPELVLCRPRFQDVEFVAEHQS